MKKNFLKFNTIWHRMSINVCWYKLWKVWRKNFHNADTQICKRCYETL